MSLAIVYTRAMAGVTAPPVTVEVHLANGLPSLTVVGLPEAAVRESKDRVRAALINAGFEFPRQRITVNLAPADLPKEGGRYDLAIAIGVLAASGQLDGRALAAYEFIGELALGGELRGVRGALVAALHAREARRRLILPRENTAEAALVRGAATFGARDLLSVCAHLGGQRSLPEVAAAAPRAAPPAPDLADVRGQHHAKRALEVAAAGGHSLLMIGPPGTGKTMLASRLPGILPPMSEAEALETAAVASVSAGGFCYEQWRRRPFRAPHHTASGPALVGGGNLPRPGEVSLAHNGVLFLDELPEFDRRALEVLREPMESGRITISRAAHQAQFPARFQLVAAMNPCPCGYHGDPAGRCRCTAEQIERYRARLSGPLLDRIDMHIEVTPVARRLMRGTAPPPVSAEILERVTRVRRAQLERDGRPAHRLGPEEITRSCRLEGRGEALLEQATERLGLSARAYHRILKLARTIADLEGEERIGAGHIGEAIGYRRLDRRAEGAAAT